MPEAGVPATPSESTDAADAKLVALARATAARTGGAGAAVRDEIGRTYVAGVVALRSLTLTAVQGAVAAAVSSGAGRVEALAVWGADLSDADRELLAELGGPAVVWAGDGR